MSDCPVRVVLAHRCRRLPDASLAQTFFKRPHKWGLGWHARRREGDECRMRYIIETPLSRRACSLGARARARAHIYQVQIYVLARFRCARHPCPPARGFSHSVARSQKWGEKNPY